MRRKRRRGALVTARQLSIEQRASVGGWRRLSGADRYAIRAALEPLAPTNWRESYGVDVCYAAARLGIEWRAALEWARRQHAAARANES